MKKTVYFITCMFAFPFLGWGQQDCSVLELSYPQTSGEYSARDMVKLNKNFTSAQGAFFRAFVDETIVCDVEYQDPIDPDTRELDLSKPVGTIAGVVDVSPTGAATYQIPIFTPPGTAGMEPQISIVYNSQSGNGLLGVGWDIAGLSAITRTPPTLYHEGELKEVNFTISDRFALDGNRLVLLQGDYIKPYSKMTFATEIETFSRITSYQGPDYFIVETKNGDSLEYGKTTDSKLNLSGSEQAILAWRLNKITDQNKNYVKYIYNQEVGESYISEIQYTGNSGSNGFAPYNSICFYYESVPEQFGYIAGYKQKNTRVLYAIKIKCEGNIVREYRFSYRNDIYSMIPRLIEIREIGSDGQEFNSTIVEWGDYKPTSSYKDITLFFPASHSSHSGDFNGDGRCDLFWTSPLSNKWKLYIADQNGGFVKQSEGDLPEDFVEAFVKSPDCNGQSTLILHKRSEEDNEYYHSFDAWALKEDGTFSTGTNYSASFMSKYSAASLLSGNFTYGYEDVRACADYIILDGKLNFVYSSLERLKENPDFDSPNDIQLLDFNGDGKTDILVVKFGKGKIFTYSEKTQKFECIFDERLFNTGGSWGKKHTLYSGDYNGDGKTDLLVLNYSILDESHSWDLYFSTGTGFTNEHLNLPFGLEDLVDIEKLKCFPGDFNGDGKTDICVIPYMRTVFYLFYSKGNGQFVKEEFQTSLPMNGLLLWHINLYSVGDFNGNGKQQLLLNYTRGELFSFHDNEKKNFVTSITDGTNLKNSFEYAPIIIGDNSFYERSIPGMIVGDVYYISGPLYAVKKLHINEINSNNKLLASYSYSYKNASMHTGGKGFFGFREKTTFNVFTDISTTEKYDYMYSVYLKPDFRYRYYGALKEKIVYRPRDTISVTTYKTEITNLGNKRIFANTESSIHHDYLKGTTVKESYIFDKDGNMKTQTTDYENKFSMTTTNIYEMKGGWGPLNRLKSTNEKNKSGSLSTTTEYTYDNKGNIKTKRTDSQDEISYEVTPRGVVEQMKSHQPGATVYPVYKYEYDSKDRFVLKTTETFMGNAVVESKTYKPATGAVLTETDAGGFTTKYRYDGFGRLINLQTPEGHIGTTNYTWASVQSNSPQSAVSCIHTQAPNRPQTWTFSDILGREIQTRTEALNNTVYVDTRYNLYAGVVDSISKPYYSGEPKKWTVYQYDVYWRNTEINDNGLKTVNTYTKGENKISTKYPDGTTVTQKFNNCGDIIETIDDGGTVRYVYNGKQLPDSIIIGNTSFYMEYNKHGNRTQLNDPNAGIIKTYYTSSDLLDYTIDARNIQTSYTYDEYNRIKTITTPETITTYTYIKTGNAKGAPDSITQTNGTGTVYKYDARGRLATLIEKVANEQRFTTNYAYDTYGNLTEITYPGGFKIKRIYNGNGFMTEIRQAGNNQMIWQRLTENALGLPLTYKMGNDKTTICEYDDYYFPVSNCTSNIQLFFYSFNPENGNLNMRIDKLKGRQESFYYDNLNRLDSIRLFNTVTHTLKYLNNGNIKNKSDVGDYFYHNTKDHAVESIFNPSTTLTQSGDQDVWYNSQHKTTQVTQGAYRLNIDYSVDNQRICSRYYENNFLQKTKYYAANYEKEVTSKTTREINYISTPYGTLAAYIKENKGTGQMYYLYKDHLGSITAITNSSGTVVERRSFDAWGRLRNPDNWNYVNIPAMDILDRGYTGHEHLESFGLINMNGRMYDPLLGWMLSPDPYTHGIAGTQGFNRYAYCLNNPLKYTDPSGENPIVIGMIVGMVINLAVNANRIDNFGQGYCYALIGLASGALGGVFGAGVGVAQGAILGAASGFTAGYVAGAGNAWVAGEDVRSSLRAGLKGGLYGAALGAVLGGIGGGIRANEMGLDPWTMEKKQYNDGAGTRRSNFSGNNKRTVERRVLAAQYDGRNPVASEGTYNCTPANINYISDGEFSQETVRNWTAPGSNPNKTAINTLRTAKHYGTLKGVPVSSSLEFPDLEELAQAMNNNHVIVSVKEPFGLGHSMTVQNIVEEVVTRRNGQQFTRILYNLMDPTIGEFVQYKDVIPNFRAIYYIGK